MNDKSQNENNQKFEYPKELDEIFQQAADEFKDILRSKITNNIKLVEWLNKHNFSYKLEGNEEGYAEEISLDNNVIGGCTADDVSILGVVFDHGLRRMADDTTKE